MKSIELSGKQYTIEFDINSGCDLEDAAGKSIGEVVNDALTNLSLTSNRLMLWGGLRKHYPDMTLTEAGDLLVGADRVSGLNACSEDMKDAGFFGRAAAKPPMKKATKASAKSTTNS